MVGDTKKGVKQGTLSWGSFFRVGICSGSPDQPWWLESDLKTSIGHYSQMFGDIKKSYRIGAP